VNPLVRRICRSPSVPLSLRRGLGRVFVPYAGRPFSLEVEGQPYIGRLDNYIDWVVYVTGQYCEYTYLRLIRTLELGGSALDVGANVGNHATALSSMFERVLAVEPYAPVFRRLERKADLLPNVDACNVGFGEAEAELEFAPPTGQNLGKGRVAEGGDEEVPRTPRRLRRSHLRATFRLLICPYRRTITETVQRRSMAVVVLPRIRWRIRECPKAPMTRRSIPCSAW
jgi:hypothetical protein